MCIHTYKHTNISKKNTLGSFSTSYFKPETFRNHFQSQKPPGALDSKGSIWWRRTRNLPVANKDSGCALGSIAMPTMSSQDYLSIWVGLLTWRQSSLLIHTSWANQRLKSQPQIHRWFSIKDLQYADL